MPNLVTLTSPPLRDRQTLSAFERMRRWLAVVADNTLGPTEEQTQKMDVIRRAAIAAVIIGVLPIQQMQIPGWPAVLAACIVGLLYDLPLAWLVFRRRQYFMANALGLTLDCLLLMGASFYVFREMGAAGSTSSIWLVFFIYIVTGGFSLAPLGSLAYTALWTFWFALATVTYFPAGSLYYEELPVRLVFMVLIGVVSLAMASELQRKRAKVEQQNRQTMGMLAQLVEARDTDAGAHLRSIQEYSRALASRLGFSAKDAEEIARASMMHDVGKANIPDAVLKKVGKLSSDEWSIMREHTVWGDQLLAESADFELARVVARAHHEHWDGSGYPDGLAGDAIPLAARIVAVADVFDALINERPYKHAWTHSEAIREVRGLSGTHLDPQVVDAFISLYMDGTVRRLYDIVPQNGRRKAA